MNDGIMNPHRRRMLKAVAGTAALGAVTPFAMGFPSSQTLLCPHVRPVDHRYFGLHIHGMAVRRTWVPFGNRLTVWPVVDFGTWRLWDAYVAWPNLQPKRYRWDFSVLDHYVELAIKHGVELLLPLGLSPEWASTRPEEASSYKPGNAAPPANLDDWRNYVCTVAERYRGKIRQYEFWNEPNAKGPRPFFTGTTEQAVELTRQAYRILKEVDPANTLAGPAGTGRGMALQWLDDYLRLGAKDSLDKISYHFYVASGTPESMIRYVGKVREIMRKHGLGHLPLVNTESGWVIANTQSPSSYIGADKSWTTLSPELGAAYVARALILGWALGFEAYHWYAWDHSSMGLIEPATKTIKPAGLAYGKVVKWLLGSTMTACESSEGVWVSTLRNPLGNTYRIVWRESGDDAPWLVPAGWNAGNYETLEGTRVVLGPSPLVLRQKPVLVR